MTTRKRRTKLSGRSYVRHWTREEQIENAKEDGTAEEMVPPLTDAERVEHEVPRQ